MFFFFKQKTAYEMRISDWSSDVCSSDLERRPLIAADELAPHLVGRTEDVAGELLGRGVAGDIGAAAAVGHRVGRAAAGAQHVCAGSEEDEGEHAEQQNRSAAHLAAEQHRQQPDEQPAHAAATATPETAASATEIADIVTGIIIVEAHVGSPAEDYRLRPLLQQIAPMGRGPGALARGWNGRARGSPSRPSQGKIGKAACG